MHQEDLFGDNLTAAVKKTRAPRKPRESKAEEAPAIRSLVGSRNVARARIILEASDEIPPTGLPIGHNGDTYVIVPGEPVEVPEFLLEILDNAVTSIPVIDPQTRQPMGYRERLRYSYRRVG